MERKERKFARKMPVKIVACVLAAALVSASVGVLAYAAGSDATKTQEESSAQTDTVANSSDVKNAKDETVYVIAGADGSVQKVIVSDWIKNNRKDQAVTDTNALKDAQNVKGNESYTMNGDGMRVWDAKGGDLYTQGTSEKDLPVTLSVRYTLDGKEISPKDLAGKSGKVSIRFDYQNNQSETVKIDGKEEKIYVPFVLLTGTLLDNDKFTDVTVTNGKIINDGDRTAVIGAALPGMQENLQLDKDKVEIPSYVEITANVKNFEMTTTVTLATSEMFSKLDTSKLNSLDDLTGAVDTLESSMKQLIDGSSALYTGLNTLLEKSQTLVSVLNKMPAQVAPLADGATKLNDGAIKLQTNLNQLAGYLTQLTANNAQLNDGAKQVYDTLLGTATTQLNAQLKEAGIAIPALTISNYGTVLDGVIAQLTPEKIQEKAVNTITNLVTAQVMANKDKIAQGVTQVVQNKVLEGVLVASHITNADGSAMTAQQYQAAVAAGAIAAPVAQQITAGVTAQMQTDAIKQQIAVATQDEIKNQITTNVKAQAALPENQQKLNAALKQAEAGTAAVKGLKEQLDSYNTFYQGVLKYTGTASQIKDGAVALANGSKELVTGTQQMKDGTKQLVNGVNELKKQVAPLPSGVKQLRDGSVKLSNGLQEFNNKGIKKLYDAVHGDIGGLVTRIKASVDVAKDYQNFSGITEQMEGTVRFIYRTDSIEVPEDTSKAASK